MSVSLANAIVHELVKEKDVPLDVSLQRINDNPLTITDPAVIALVDRIETVYGTRENSCDYGIFLSNGREGLFPAAYEAYTQGTSDFVSMTRVFMQELITQAAEEEWSTGGYVVCAEYTSHGTNFLTISMIKKSSEIRFDPNLRPEEITAINLKKLHQAVRINKNRFFDRPQTAQELQDYNYLSFISDVSSGASKYFISATGCEKGPSSRRATDKVYAYVQTKFSETEALAASKLAARDALTELFENKISLKRPVTLNDIVTTLKAKFSDRFSDQEQREAFFDSLHPEMNSDQQAIPNTFNPSQSAVNAKKRVKYNTSTMSISIDSEIIDSNNSSSAVYWNAEEGKLIITADTKLKNEIQTKLLGDAVDS